MPKYLLYKPLKNLAKILSFGQNIEISLGGYFFAHPVYCLISLFCFALELILPQILIYPKFSIDQISPFLF